MYHVTNCVCFRELMMGDEGKPGKKIKVKGRVKRPDRPPENPVVDVSLQFKCLYVTLTVFVSEPCSQRLSRPFPADAKVRASAGVPGHHGGDAAPLPAGGSQLAALLVGSGHRHHPGRRDGSGQDGPDRRLPLLAL